MISVLMGLGLGKRVAQVIAYVAVPLLVLALLYWALDSYGDRRYRDGVETTDAKWEEAGRRLKAQAARSATKADDAAAVRLDRFEAQVAKEQEKLDEAERNGTSPLDVLFGG